MKDHIVGRLTNGKWFLNGFSAIDRFDLNLGQSKDPRLMSLIHGSVPGICLELLMLSQRVSGRCWAQIFR